MPDVAASDRCLNVQALSERWGCSAKLIRHMVRKKMLTPFGLGDRRKRWRFTPEAICDAERRMSLASAEPRRRRRSDIDPDIARLLE